jgi:pimeloyl-ACP methyl ester carboxylesterase
MLRFGLALAAWAATAEATEPTFQYIAGHGGVPLATMIWGNSDGPGILFIHGFSQSMENFRKQMDDPALAAEFHMVAFDQRGHGASGKPWTPESYGATQPFADDIAAVMRATNLKKPTLVGWSMGGLMLMDYVRHHGTEDIAGLMIVGSNAGIGARQRRGAPNDPDRQRRIRQISDDILASIDGVGGLVDSLSIAPLDAGRRQVLLIGNMQTPAYVRRIIAAHPWPNADLISKIDVPVLFSYGSEDTAIDTKAIPGHAAMFKDARVSIYQNLGHSPFWEDATRFNSELTAFVRASRAKEKTRRD